MLSLTYVLMEMVLFFLYLYFQRKKGKKEHVLCILLQYVPQLLWKKNHNKSLL